MWEQARFAGRPFAHHLGSPDHKFGVAGLLTAICRFGIVERVVNIMTSHIMNSRTEEG
jgi:hypothetical protein